MWLGVFLLTRFFALLSIYYPFSIPIPSRQLISHIGKRFSSFTSPLSNSSHTGPHHLYPSPSPVEGQGLSHSERQISRYIPQTKNMSLENPVRKTVQCALELSISALPILEIIIGVNLNGAYLISLLGLRCLCPPNHFVCMWNPHHLYPSRKVNRRRSVWNRMYRPAWLVTLESSGAHFI